MAKARILQRKTVLANAVKMPSQAWYIMCEVLAPRAGNGGNVCSPTSYFCVCVRKIGLLTGRST